MTLIMVRHGDTGADSVKKYWGRSDVELNATGLEQAEGLHKRLLSEKIDAIYASTRKRAYVTAEIIASGRELNITRCAELDEVNFGEIEGLTYDEICRLYPEVTKLWANWSLELSFPGGESFDQFNSRVAKFLERLKRHAPEETVLIVGHGGPFRLMVCHLLGLGLEHWWQCYFDLASVSIVETYPQGAILNLLNDVRQT